MVGLANSWWFNRCYDSRVFFKHGWYDNATVEITMELMMSIWSNERTEIATWLSGYLNMVKTWVDKILDNEHYDVDKNKIIGLIDEWILWLEETKLKIMKMKDVDPEGDK